MAVGQVRSSAMTVRRQYVSVCLDVGAACVDGLDAQLRTAWLKCWSEWKSVENHRRMSTFRLCIPLIQQISS